jgi:hypothetical protein
MSPVRACAAVVALVAAFCAVIAIGFSYGAWAATSTATRSDGYSVTLTGPGTGTVGVASSYSATCGYPGATGPCPYGEFRAFGGPINRLGEGFGRGALGTYTFRAAGSYQIRYRVGAGCIGSPRRACPIDVWVYTGVTAP